MSASIKLAALGHVVLRVDDLDKAEAFYRDLLEIRISARAPEWSMIFFTLGQHHDFAISAAGVNAGATTTNEVGLDHVAFRVEGGLDGLRAARQKLEGAGIEVAGIDHTVTRSLYFRDPAGNGVELYVNGSEEWRSDPGLILSEAKALEL